MSDESTISRSPSPVGWIEPPNAQDYESVYFDEALERERRQECQEAGYLSEHEEEQGESSSNAADRNNEGNIEGSPRGGGVSGCLGIFRGFKRQRVRSPVQLTILGERLLAGISNGINRGQRRLVRETIDFSYTTNVHQEVENLSASLQRKYTLFAISRHDDPYLHYHVVHACPWKWYTCRCYCPTGGKRSLRTSELRALTDTDWAREFEYLSSEGRTLQYLYCGTTFSKSLRGIKLLFPEEIRNNSSQGPVENVGHSVQDGCNQPGVDNSTRADGSMVGTTSKLPKSTSRPKPEEVERFILTYLCVPITSITMTTVWQASKFRFLTDRHPILSQVISSIRSRINHWMYSDFLQFYNEYTPLFACLNGQPSDYYYDKESSAAVIDKLLRYQMEDFAAAWGVTTDEAVKTFLQEIYDVCEKRLPKRNSFELIGPASCGKSYLVDMIVDYYINVGHIKNFNRNESFPLQSAYNRRINVWNEAQCEAAALDWVKLFLGGDPCPANIKYEDNKTIARTPTFITANMQLIPNTQPFKDRMIRYSWKTAPWLKEYTKKPTPLCISLLYNKYEINF